MSVYDIVREGIAEDLRKASAYNYVRQTLEKVLHSKSKQLGHSLSEEIRNCLNNTPSSRESVPDAVLRDWDDR